MAEQQVADTVYKGLPISELERLVPDIRAVFKVTIISPTTTDPSQRVLKIAKKLENRRTSLQHFLYYVLKSSLECKVQETPYHRVSVTLNLTDIGTGVFRSCEVVVMCIDKFMERLMVLLRDLHDVVMGLKSSCPTCGYSFSATI